MPLTYNLRNIDDWENACLEEEECPSALTTVIIHLALIVGVPNITKGTASEFYSRVLLYEKLFGVFMHTEDGEERGITPDDVRSHVGLTTNASPHTEAAFRKTVWSRYMHEARAEYAAQS
jgi:hypothetical protein